MTSLCLVRISLQLLEMMLGIIIVLVAFATQRGKKSLESLEYFDLHVTAKAYKIQLVLWKSPSSQWSKLNIDGASRRNPGDSGAKGIIRDQKCKLLLAFAHFLGVSTPVYAETESLLLGIAFANELQLRHLWIESESLFLVRENFTKPT